MNPINEIRELLINESLENIYSKGLIIDDDDILEFHNSLTSIYLEFESKIIKIHRRLSTDFEVTLSVIPIENLSNDFNDDTPNEYKAAITSLIGMFIYEDRGNNKVSRVDAYAISDEAYNNATFKSVGFAFGKNSYLFLDGYGMHGIELGKESEMKAWKQEIMGSDNEIIIGFNKNNLQLYTWSNT